MVSAHHRATMLPPESPSTEGPLFRPDRVPMLSSTPNTITDPRTICKATVGISTSQRGAWRLREVNGLALSHPARMRQSHGIRHIGVRRHPQTHTEPTRTHPSVPSPVPTVQACHRSAERSLWAGRALPRAASGECIGTLSLPPRKRGLWWQSPAPKLTNSRWVLKTEKSRGCFEGQQSCSQKQLPGGSDVSAETPKLRGGGSDREGKRRCLGRGSSQRKSGEVRELPSIGAPTPSPAPPPGNRVPPGPDCDSIWVKRRRGGGKPI